jgi:hypothetical protein
MEMPIIDNDIYSYISLCPVEYVEKRRVSCMLPTIPGTNKLSMYLTCKINEFGNTELYVIKKPHTTHKE